ncbi:beta-1,3-galactosyltransferase brn-like [Pecten maximus]|uniref:beta-1,3-galactosyltransferase brn-like n=1 Tax=Pecten maximus TaxID=6579 RepID=UPI001458F594|nr:beta-1,3-galactosyltransferase brn-like [Pecten maximus]XP_033724573.1 beta-1,3-galactosyltransferase brn-like [Pecten maximus]
MTSRLCPWKHAGLVWGLIILATFTYFLLYLKLTDRNTRKHHMTAYWLQWITFMNSKKSFTGSRTDIIQSNDSVSCVNQNSTMKSFNLCQINSANSKSGTDVHGYIPFNNFEYPLEIDMNDLVSKLKTNRDVSAKPIFTYPHTFIKSPTWMCETRNVRLLIVVKSGVTHFKRREMIRNTWGNNTSTSSGIVTLFLLGSTKHVMYQRQIKREHNSYGDIIQMSFYDDYYNNTLKTVGGIKWARNHCNQSKFVLFTDDDFYIAPDRLVYYTENVEKYERTSFYRGAMWENGRPIRNEHNKWYISREDYPFDRYPDFIAAGFMLFSIDFVIDLDLAIPFTKKFIFDDVYISIVAYKLHVSPSNMKGVHIHKFPYSREGFLHVIASHGYDRASTLERAWWIHQNKQLHKYGRKNLRAYSVKAI